MDAGEIEPEAVARAFGNVLRYHRRRRSLSQEKLAEAIDMDRTYISMLERGIHQPSLTVFLRVAQALDVPANDMIESVRQKCLPE